MHHTNIVSVKVQSTSYKTGEWYGGD